MTENKPRIEDDFKNLFNVLKQNFKKIFPMLDFSFLKDYGQTERKRKLHSRKFHNKEEILQFYKGRGWKPPKEDGKD